MDERPCIGSPKRLLGEPGTFLSSASEAYEQAYRKTLRDESSKDSGILLSLPPKLDVAPLSSKFGDFAPLSSKFSSGDLRDFLPGGHLSSGDGLRRSGTGADSTPHFGGNAGVGLTEGGRSMPSRLELTLKSPNAHRERHIELAPGETIEISSPRLEKTKACLSQSFEVPKSSRELLNSVRQGGAMLPSPSLPSFSNEALPSAVNVQVASSHLERENERQRMEILSLKQEIETLLRTNSMLQAQLDVERKRHGSGDDFHFTSADPQLGPQADAESRVAWMEERREIEKEIMKLREKCRTLEMEKMMAQTKLSAATNRQELSGASLREPELAQKIRMEEAARQAAEQRVHYVEDQLARSQAQCEELRKRMPEAEKLKTDDHRKAKELEAQVDSLRTTNEEQERTLHECNDRVLQGQRDLQGIRSDYDILVRTNEGLKQENARLKDDLDSTKEKVRIAETQVASLRSQFSMTENQLSTKVDQLANMAHASNEELEHKRRQSGEVEKELSTWRTDCLELKSQLASLRTAHEDLKARSESREGDLCSEIVSWKQKYSELSAEKELLGTQLDGALQEKQDLQARSQDYLKQCEEASKALMNERKRAQEMNDRSKGMVIEMERRSQALMRQMDDEKHRNAQLTRELSAACEAARRVQVHPRTRAKSSSKYSSDALEPGPRTPDKSAKGKNGWSAVITRMQKELDELQQWKGTALSSLQKSQGGMDYLQSKYKRQLQYNQQLQQRLEELGRHAKEAIGSVEHGGPGQSSDDDLCSPSAIPKPSGTSNGFQSSTPTGTSNDLLGSHPEDVLGAVLANSSSTGVLGSNSKDHRSRSQEHQRSQRSIRSEPVRIPAGRHMDHHIAGPDLPENYGKVDFRAGRPDFGEFSSSTMDGDSQASSSLIDTWPSSHGASGHGVFYDMIDRSASRSFGEGNRKRRSRSLGGGTRARRREDKEPLRPTAKLVSKSSAKSL